MSGRSKSHKNIIYHNKKPKVEECTNVVKNKFILRKRDSVSLMLRILTVCTGNICRSPLAEAVLRQDLPSEYFSVSSAGIMAVPQGSVPEPQLRIAETVGVTDLVSHRARALTPGKIGASDLLLGLSRHHRKRIVRMDPQAVRRTFTLREFAHLAFTVTPAEVELHLAESKDPFTAGVEAVTRKRGMAGPPASPEDFDVVDPFRQSRKIYILSRDQLVPAAEIVGAYFNGILDIFGTGDIAPHYLETTEPDLVSQGIPKVQRLLQDENFRKHPRQ